MTIISSNALGCSQGGAREKRHQGSPQKTFRRFTCAISAQLSHCLPYSVLILLQISLLTQKKTTRAIILLSNSLAKPGPFHPTTNKTPNLLPEHGQHPYHAKTNEQQGSKSPPINIRRGVIDLYASSSSMKYHMSFYEQRTNHSACWNCSPKLTRSS